MIVLLVVIGFQLAFSKMCINLISKALFIWFISIWNIPLLCCNTSVKVKGRIDSPLNMFNTFASSSMYLSRFCLFVAVYETVSCVYMFEKQNIYRHYMYNVKEGTSIWRFESH